IGRLTQLLDDLLLCVNFFQQRFCTIMILDATSSHHDFEDQSQSVYQGMPVTFFPASKPRSEPPSDVLADWLSNILALGWRFLPNFSRAFSRGKRLMRSQVPSFRHKRK